MSEENDDFDFKSPVFSQSSASPLETAISRTPKIGKEIEDIFQEVEPQTPDPPFLSLPLLRSSKVEDQILTFPTSSASFVWKVHGFSVVKDMAKLGVLGPWQSSLVSDIFGDKTSPGHWHLRLVFSGRGLTLHVVSENPRLKTVYATVCIKSPIAKQNETDGFVVINKLQYAELRLFRAMEMEPMSNLVFSNDDVLELECTIHVRNYI